jgi:hypothetical protein
MNKPLNNGTIKKNTDRKTKDINGCLDNKV